MKCALQVNATFVYNFGDLVTQHSIDVGVYHEIREILLQCCHQFSRVRIISVRYFNELVSSFPSLLCEATVVDVLLELLTVLRRACQAEFIDEVCFLTLQHLSRLGAHLLPYSTLPPTLSNRLGEISCSPCPTTTLFAMVFCRRCTSWLKLGSRRPSPELLMRCRVFCRYNEYFLPATSFAIH